MCHWHIYSQYRKPKPAQCSQLKKSCVKYLCQERNQNDQSPKHSIERKSQILQRKVVKSTFPGWKVFNTRFRGHRAGGKVRSPKEERPQNLFSPALTVSGVDRTGEGKGTRSHLHSSHPSPVTRTPHSHSITPCSHSQPLLLGVLGLTCSTHTLFHALLAAARAWGLACRLFRRPTVALALAAAAGRSGSSHPRPSGSDNRGCRPPGRAVSCSRARAHTPGRRTQPATGRGAAGSPGRAQARTRTEAPSPIGKPTNIFSLPRDTRRPNLGSRRRHTLLPHPFIFTVTRPPSPPPSDYRLRGQAFALWPLSSPPSLCGSPSPRLPVFTASGFFSCLGLFGSQFSF